MNGLWVAVRAVAWDQIATLLAPLPLIVVANLADRGMSGFGPGETAAYVKRGTTPFGSVGFRTPRSRLGVVTWAVLLVLAVSFGLYGLGAALAYTSRHAGAGSIGFGLVTAATGVVAGVTLMRPVRVWLARYLPLNPDSAVHGTALMLSILLFGSQIAPQFMVDVLARQAATATPLTPIDLALQEIPFLLLAFAGVGLLTRRPARATLQRLGLVAPRPWHLLLALAAAGAFYAFSTGADALAYRLTPGVANEVQNATQRIFGQLDNPVGIATIAIAAGICEETFFRGALQPRLGLLWTALLFTAVHSQYGISIDALAVAILAICLGLIRRYLNTTSSAVCHVAYNALVGAGLGAWAAWAGLLEGVLVTAILATWFLTTQRVGSASGDG